MFKKNLKLIGTAIGLVAVLVVGLTVPGATQQNPLSRQSVVQTVSQVVQATLVASAEEFFNTDKFVFYSGPEVTAAFISAHSASRAWQLLRQLAAGEEVGVVTFGLLYVPDGLKKVMITGGDPPITLAPGLYKLQALAKDKMAIADQEGRVLASGAMRLGPGPDCFTPPECFGIAFSLQVGNPTTIIITIEDDNTITIEVK